MKKDAFVRKDPFIQRFLAHMPEVEQHAFTDTQLSHIKSVFSTDSSAKHAIQWRGTVNVWRRRYFYVFLAGHERRQLSRREESMARAAKASILFGFLAFSILTGLLILYLVKSALGIDLIKGYSLGIWDWFQHWVSGS